jgi:hypothetical protein
MKFSFVLGFVASLIVIWSIWPFFPDDVTLGYGVVAAMFMGLARECKRHKQALPLDYYDFLAATFGGAIPYFLS